MSSNTKTARIDEVTHFNLKAISQQYDVPMTILIDVIVNSSIGQPIEALLPTDEQVNKAMEKMADNFSAMEFKRAIKTREFVLTDIFTALYILCKKGELNRSGVRYNKISQDAI